ncbi:MAG TPA: sugar ABC transporter substrate-binding protein [Microbacterium sp.]|nr:sugar ABC transporter substrate-binding protein [Microbacterium sp.]
MSTLGTRRAMARRTTAMIGAVGAAALVLSGCGSPDEQGTSVASSDGAIEETSLPAYVPIDAVEPDFPGVDGSPSGYLELPDPLVKGFDSPPGSGGEYTAMTPLWGTIPPTSGNQYLDAVSEAMGTTIDFQISDGNTYGDKLAAVLASPKDMPDWISIPSWNVPPRFGTGVDKLFEDLTPYLGGDAAKDYPYLANIPTDAWRACSWNGKLYGIPQPAEGNLGNWFFYRDDLLPDAELPTNADEMLEFVEQNTADGHYGTDDLWNIAQIMFAVPDKWAVGDDGKLVSKFETPEYRAALEWTATLFASGAVHPDAIAGDTSGAQQRFESGQVLVTGGGVGYYHEALTRMRATDPDFSIKLMPVFAADGGTPVLYKTPAAGICSYLKKTDDEAQVKELLTAANFMAAPFGTEEYQLLNYGVEGVHYTPGEGGVPQPTELAQTEIQPTYIFLVGAPIAIAKTTLPDYVENYTTWMAQNVEYLTEPPFFGQNITEPSQYASLGQPFEDLASDIARGRKTIDDLDKAIETWKSSGGEELRAFYQEIYDGAEQGD